MTKPLKLLIGAAAAFLLVALVPMVVEGPGLSDAALNFDEAMESGTLMAFGVVFLGGVLTSFTPCVYPIIPITVSVFGASSAGSRLKGAALSSVYVLGMAVMYAGLGLAAALTGKVFGSIMTNVWVIGGISLVFVVFAASMLGAFELVLPSSLQTRLAQVGGKGWFGAFAMGLVAGVIAAPCTGPVLGGVLTYVATTQDAVLGTALLFTFAIGMGGLFFVIGTFSVSLPKSGPWMDSVESAFAVAMLAVALFFLKDVVPPLKAVLSAGSWVGWVTGALAAAGVLVGGIHLTFRQRPTLKALKAVGLVLLVGSVSYRAASLTVVGEPPDDGSGLSLHWESDEREALEKARAAGKPLMIDFTADWCAACKELQKYTFPEARVAAELQRFVTAKIDLTDDESDEYARLYEKYRFPGLPYVVFVGSDGKRQDELTVTGFRKAEDFLEILERVK